MRHVEPGIVVTISRSRLSLNTAASLRRLSGVDVEHCQCDACKDGVIHASDCAVHNEPAYRNGPCDCMAIQATPGPWRIVDREVLEDGSVYPKHIVGGVAEFQVCLLEGPEVARIRHENPGWCSTATGDANAHLLAASPDLLAVAQEVLKTPGLQSGLQALCAAAVAKAMGKSIDDVIGLI